MAYYYIMKLYTFINASPMHIFVSVASKHLKLSEIYKHCGVATSQFLEFKTCTSKCSIKQRY